MLNSVNEYMLIYIYVNIYIRDIVNVCRCEWLYNVYVFIYEDITLHIYIGVQMIVYGILIYI